MKIEEIIEEIIEKLRERLEAKYGQGIQGAGINDRIYIWATSALNMSFSEDINKELFIEIWNLAMEEAANIHETPPISFGNSEAIKNEILNLKL